MNTNTHPETGATRVVVFNGSVPSLPPRDGIECLLSSMIVAVSRELHASPADAARATHIVEGVMVEVSVRFSAAPPRG
jgi:hypothetical protein